MVSLFSVYSLKQLQRNLPLCPYIVKEKIHPWELPRIFMTLSKRKEQETFDAAQSSYETTYWMINNTTKFFTELLLQPKVR